MNTNNNDNKSNNNLSITSYPLELQITLFIVFITSVGLTLFLVSLGGEEKEQQTLLKAYPKIILRYTIMQQARCTSPR